MLLSSLHSEILILLGIFLAIYDSWIVRQWMSIRKWNPTLAKYNHDLHLDWKWLDQYIMSTEISEISVQLIPYSTLQRYQISALDLYSKLAEEIHRPNEESLEARIAREFASRSALPLKRAHLEAKLNRARRLRDQGDFSAALLINQECLEENPTDYRPIISSAKILWKRRKIDECVRILQQGLQRVRNEPHLIQHLASVFSKINRRDDAIKILKLGLEEYPTFGASWLTLANLYLLKGEVAAARSCYSTAVQNDPHSYANYLAWANLEFRSGDISFAKELVTKALFLSPNNYKTWELVAKILIQDQKLREAKEFLQQCLSRHPHLSILYPSLLSIYEIQFSSTDPNIIDSFIETIVRTARANGDAKSLVELASFQQRQLRRFYEKVNEFLVSMDIQPIRFRDNSPLVIASSNITTEHFLLPINEPIDSEKMTTELFFRQNPDTFLYEFQQLLRQHNQTLSVSNRIVAFGLMKQIQEYLNKIRSYYQTAVKANQYYTNIWIYWSEFERSQGNYDIARKILIAGIEKFPHSRTISKFHMALGDLANSMGDIETARACYERALSDCPKHVSLPIYFRYYEMELRTGNKVKANKIYQIVTIKFPSKYNQLNEIRRKYEQ